MVAIAAIPVLMIIKYDDFWLNEIAFITILFLLVFLLYIMTGKVIVGETYITKRTIFGTRSIKTGDKNYDPMSRKQKGTIKSHYREDFYLDILRRIAECKRSRYDDKT